MNRESCPEEFSVEQWLFFHTDEVKSQNFPYIWMESSEPQSFSLT